MAFEGQATLLNQIDAFLALGPDHEFDSDGLRVGILLCTSAFFGALHRQPWLPSGSIEAICLQMPFQNVSFPCNSDSGMLCILLWCLYICNEFRAIFLSVEAILQVPRRSHTTFDHGRFTTMSYSRFALYCLARLIRAIIAGLLLYAGILWLGNTTSITDLMLNAVALGAVLDVDQMFFAALMPKKIQIKIQDLEARES